MPQAIDVDEYSRRVKFIEKLGFVFCKESSDFKVPLTGISVSAHQLTWNSSSEFENFLSSLPVNIIHPKNSEVKGLRYNTGKAKWSLIDFPSLEPMVRVMEYGANKYAPHNWKKGMPHTEIAECLMRHLVAYLNGEDKDPESKLSHISHVQSNAMMLQYNIQNHPELDDRFKPSK